MVATMLVTGGTGTLGRSVVVGLRRAGVPVRVLSRHPSGPDDGVEYRAADLSTGAGVESAVEGAETIVHCAGSAKGDEEKARRLVAAATRVGAKHLISISVVGADAIPVVSRIDRAMFGYFAAKHGAERAVGEGEVPWTILRATQFHDLVLTVTRQMAKLPLIPVPSGFRFQPVDSGAVADRLVELALGDPAGLVPDIAGPRVYEMGELLRSYLRAAGRRRLTVPIHVPGRAAAAIRSGATLAPTRGTGPTWEAFLAGHLADTPH